MEKKKAELKLLSRNSSIDENSRQKLEQEVKQFEVIFLKVIFKFLREK